MISLINDNCLVALKKFEDIDNKILVTDPPFNIGYKYRSYKDKMTSSEYFNMLYTVFSYFDKQVLIAYPEILYEFSARYRVIPNRVCSWVYNSNTPRQHRDIAFYGFYPDFKKHGQPYKNENDKRVKKLIAQGKHARLYDWWNVNQVKNVSKEKLDHPCQMPLDVMLNICGTLPENNIVIDPFAGVFTTGIACAKLNIPCVGIEIDTYYYELGIKRIYNA